MSTIPEMNYCPGCGKRILVGERTCAGCGHPLPHLSGTSAVDDPESYLEYAGFWRRFGAYFIDAIILNVVVFVLGFVGGAVGALTGLSSAAINLAAAVLSLLLPWLYFAAMESSSIQATIGKLALGIQVTDLRGEPVSFLRATGRFWARIPSGLILSIGYIMAAFTERKQALHDILAGTLVVRR